MKMQLAVFFGFWISSMAFAGTDFSCMGDCENRGYQHQLCLKRCSYGEGGAALGPRTQGYLAGQQLIIQQQQIQQQQMRNQMIQNANAACQKGNQKACSDLRGMLFSK